MIVFILIVFILYNIKFKKNDFFNDSCNIENTLSIKGIFVILVFFAHISEYLILNQNIFDSSYFKLKQAMGQLIVVYFLFFSGYGLFYSIKKGGGRNM
ncbi:hypothetical protein [Thomasclavelia cocleata]|uniref:hypothetical protein n=1 Tax=Thomasclavelia cocleata TaxID=69824 RepID=UPI00255AED68|nr:hypothetical protein [Thomasclavelia cocleata]